jgi:hypothetical protein
MRLAIAERDSCDGSARRGGRYRAAAHTGSVGAAHRLRCDARIAVAPQNPLRSLRSIRSDSFGESDHEASVLRAPTAMLRFSPPHKSPPPGTAHRAESLAALFDEHLGGAGKAAGGCASAATYAAPRSAGRMAARASALRHLTRRDCSSTANELGAASFATGHVTEHRREPFAKRRAAAFERRRIPARGFASLRSRQGAKPMRRFD